jgi:hypothetical protein
VQFAALDTTTLSDPSFTHHHTHTWSLCHAIVFISQLNDFSWFCHFMFGKLFVHAGSVNVFLSCGLFN